MTLNGAYICKHEKNETLLSLLLIPFFKELENKNISYCVLRNYDDLPYYTNNDVDIWVENISEAEAVLRKAAQKNNLQIIMRMKRGGICNYWYASLDGCATVIHIDLLTSLQWRNTFLIEPEIIKNNLIKFKEFFIPNKTYEGVYILLSGLLTRGEIKEKYQGKIITAYKDDSSIFKTFLNKNFGQSNTEIILMHISSENWNGIKQIIQKLKISFLIRAFLRAPFSQSIKWFFYSVDWIKLIFKPQGIHIVLEGVDGSGKTTIKEMIALELRKIFPLVKNTWWFARCIPLISELTKYITFKKTQKKINAINKTSPEIKLDRFKEKPAKAYFRTFYYFFDYLIASYTTFKFIKIWGGVVLSDRFYYDFLVDLQLNKIKPPQWLPKILLKLLPKPNIVFYLDIPPEVAVHRKNEDSVESVQKQIDSWNKILPDIKNLQKINSLESIDSNFIKIKYCLLNYLAKQNKENS